MPLLHKKPFTLNEFPPDLRESEEVFFCTSTREIFRDYDEFCERIILCNSLVWSCALTGRSHLTYQEALASEQKVKGLLKRFPMELRIPVLYLASLCERRSLIDLAEDVFTYVKDRFFIGETVQINFDNGKTGPCHILAVVPPKPEELQGIKQHSYKNGERLYWWPPASMYKYEVESLENNEEMVVSAEQIARNKSTYNKDKNRLYIKQFVHLDSGYWRLKEAAYVKYGISRVKFNQIFCGEPPVMVPKQSSPMRKKSSDKGKRQETLNKYFKHQSPSKQNVSQKRAYTKRNDISRNKPNGKFEKQKKRRRTKKEIEESNRMKISSKEFLEAKAKAKASKKEERMKLAEFVKEWNRKREDLECEDLKELPVPHPVRCKVPNEYFGDVVLLMEFVTSFHKILPVKDFFPNGICFELIERALIETEIAGPFCDILQMLLATVFDLLEQEAEEQKETDIRITPYLVLERGDESVLEVLKRATAAEAWIKQHHAAPLSQLNLDTSTITEIVRLHLLSSGAKQKDKCGKWRYQARGGYCGNDDPAVMLKVTDLHIIHHLSQNSVCELQIGDKVTVINCLVNQILTYSNVRDIVDEGCDKARQCRVELRSLNAAEARREKEEAIRQKELKQKGEEVVEENNTELQRETRNNPVQDVKKEQQRLVKELTEALAGARVAPLGTDRAYRRFWMFKSLPGLFVEHQEENPGPCLPKGTPMFNGMVDEDSYAYVRRLFEEGANKENFSEERLQKLHMNSPNKKFLAEKNGSDSPIFRRSFKNEEISLEPLTCWGDITICPVHGEAAKHVTWGFYCDEAAITRLIDSLNRRGIRERKLRQELLMAKECIIKNLPMCPIERLNPSLADKSIELRPKNNAMKMMKQYENANLSFPIGTPLDTVMERTLRDLILETEEKVNAGHIGNLKVKDRIAWREALAEQKYDKQCKKLSWGGKYVANAQVLVSDEIKKEETMDEDIKKDGDTSSRSSTPSIDLTHQGHIGNEQDPIAQRPIILDLASAILQIEQSVDLKFLKRPLGLDLKEKERAERMPTPTQERWEAALMESTSFPQLFLHLSTLENSVEWARSALNAYCRICKRKTDPENMLLCDTCNKGHHLYCLKPKLTRVPQGDWHCPRCKPKEKVTPVKRKRHFFSEDSDDDEEEEEEVEMICKVCNDNGAQLNCDSCDVKLHLTCVNPPVRKVPKSKWVCHDCRVQNSLAQQAKAESKLEMKAESKAEPRKSETRRSESKKSISFVEQECEKERDWSTLAERISSMSSPGDVERSSRRRCSKAATAKISQFAKQLRSNSWDGDDDRSENKPELRESSRRRANRRSYETPESEGLPLDNAALQEILDEIMHHKDAWPFLRPVTKAEVPDYHTIIKRPMDFGTIKHKLNMLQYRKNSELFADAELLFSNCYTYNEEGSEVYNAGEKLETMFTKLCKDHNLTIDRNDLDTPPSKRSRPVL